MRKMRQLLKPSKKVDQIEELRKIAKLSGVKLPHQKKKDAPKVRRAIKMTRIVKVLC